MVNIQQIKESIDVKLDTWEAKASAMEAQLELTRDQALDRLEDKKRQFRSHLDDAENKINQINSAADIKKTEVIAAIGNLRVQLALAKADSKDAYNRQKQAIENAISTFEARVEQVVDKHMSMAAAQLAKESNALRGELDAAQIQFSEKQSELRTKFKKQRAALQSEIQIFKNELNAKRQLAKDKAATFEGELSQGLQQIRDAFNRLF